MVDAGGDRNHLSPPILRLEKAAGRFCDMAQQADTDAIARAGGGWRDEQGKGWMRAR